jgi:hypothetical protein
VNDFVGELHLALEVLKRWETLVALVGFIMIWSLFRYVALVRRKGPRFHFSLPQRKPKQAAPEPEIHPAENEEEPKEESGGRASRS